jgi:hypothetical protein
MKNQISINAEFLNELKNSDLESWIIVQQAYRDCAIREEVMCAGMNLNTGYVYIALENGVTIASCFGQRVDFIVTDFEDGEEFFFDTYREALEKQYQL